MEPLGLGREDPAMCALFANVARQTPGAASQGLRYTAAGHLRSILPGLLKYAARWQSPEERVVTAAVHDAELGTVKLSALYAKTPGADTLAIVIHGHGGSAGKPYCHRAAVAARRRGFSTLRISLRGADLRGEDIYHGGLTSDLAAFAGQPAFVRYRRIVLFGFSIGGHLALRAALDGIDPRLSAVIAVSPPLDIAAAVEALDSPRRWLYRRYIIAGLHRIYAAVDAHGRSRTPLQEVRRAATFRAWDELTIVPRFGFRSVDDYYDRITLKHRLGGLCVPALIVGSNHDPVIPPAVMRDALDGASRAVTGCWVDGGGHLHFPAGTGLGFGPVPGLAAQCWSWAGREAL